MTTKMEVNVTSKMEVDMKDIADLLCTGFEGGVGYWCQIVGYKKPEKVFEWDVYSTKDGHVYKYVQYPLSEGGEVWMEDSQGESDEEWTLDLPAIERGLSVMASKYPWQWSNFVGDQYDADTGDVFIQCCLFGAVVYG
jgi:hypothetical protein